MKGTIVRSIVVAVAALPLQAVAGQAQEAVTTRVMIRVVARDSKIIGSGVGGALVRVTEAATGDVLAEGKQEGSSGSTQLIMSTPLTRDMSRYDTEGAAGFLAELALTEPTVVNITATGPLGYPHAVRKATKQLLLVPGGHIEGDGIELELHGFIVEVLTPEPLTPVASDVEVKARVRMMCGCVIEPGGMWDSNHMQMTARLKADGRVVAVSSLDYAGEPTFFEGRLSVPPGLGDADVTLEVLVADPTNQNFGRHEIPLSG